MQGEEKSLGGFPESYQAASSPLSGDFTALSTLLCPSRTQPSPAPPQERRFAFYQGAIWSFSLMVRDRACNLRSHCLGARLFLTANAQPARCDFPAVGGHIEHSGVTQS